MTDVKKNYKVKVNDFEFFFDEEDIKNADVVARSASEFNIIKDKKSANVAITNVSNQFKKMKIDVDGDSFDVEIKNELDQMLDQMGFSASAVKVLKEIKAPMPGLVLSIAVQEGQDVKEGERILILEAMKMENSIVIHGDATIKKINVKPGQAVDKGQVLVELN